MQGKRAAGRHAADLVVDGALLGLGTGSTVSFVLERLAERLAAEELRFRGVPTSRVTEAHAQALGLPLTTLEEHPQLDLTIDGADEVDPSCSVIKGGGGALLREKIVAAASAEMIVVVDQSKLVSRLGERFLLPLEVLPFGYRSICLRLADLGCEPFLRSDKGGNPFISDNGNYVIDCRFKGGIDDPADLERRLALIPGVLESGLFVGLAGRVIVGKDDGSVER